MREIKFRAWDTTAHKMEPVGEITFDIGLEVAIGNHNGKTRSVNMQYQPHVILMQFTGLKDKSGKEIYEGDLVKNENGVLRVVEFHDGSFTFGDYYFGSIGAGRVLEVVGNIYEDSELLEVHHEKN